MKLWLTDTYGVYTHTCLVIYCYALRENSLNVCLLVPSQWTFCLNGDIYTVSKTNWLINHFGVSWFIALSNQSRWVKNSSGTISAWSETDNTQLIIIVSANNLIVITACKKGGTPVSPTSKSPPPLIGPVISSYLCVYSLPRPCRDNGLSPGLIGNDVVTCSYCGAIITF